MQANTSISIVSINNISHVHEISSQIVVLSPMKDLSVLAPSPRVF